MRIWVMRIILLFIFLGSACGLFAQRISNTAVYRNINSVKYFRLHYENDYFSTSDLYYTQGINLEYVNPAIGNFFTSKLLFRSAEKEMKFGMSLEQEGYTPTSISHAEILKDDRPFAAALFFKAFSAANDAVRKERISSSLSVGWIGSATGGEQIQEALHRLIHYILPKGWSNQIANDVVLNYELEYQREIFSADRYFSWIGRAGARGGTFNTKAWAGTIFMAGYFDDPFIHFSRQERKFQVYLYAEPMLNIVGHDATLQGGLFNRSSPYTISSTDINRTVFQGNTGIVFRINTVQLEYFQTYITKEFKTGEDHVWGGIRVGWYLK
jgi:lipid A 3-O-deacylase